MKTAIWVLLISCSAIAAPSTRPTTAPSVASLRAKLESLRQAGQSQWDASEEKKKLLADYSAKTYALERLAPDSPQRKDAVAARDAAWNALQSARSAAIETPEMISTRLDLQETIEIEKRITHQTEAEKRQAAKAEKERIENDPILKAIREERVIPGMTFDQVKEAKRQGRVPTLRSQSEKDEVWEFSEGDKELKSGMFRAVFVRFHEGKAILITYGEWTTWR